MNIRSSMQNDYGRKDALSTWGLDQIFLAQQVSDNGSDGMLFRGGARHNPSFQTTSWTRREQQATSVETLGDTGSVFFGRDGEDKSRFMSMRFEQLVDEEFMAEESVDAELVDEERLPSLACPIFVKHAPRRHLAAMTCVLSAVERLLGHIRRPYAKADEIGEHVSRTKDIETAKSPLPVLSSLADDGRRRYLGLELAANMGAWSTSAILSYFAKESEGLYVLGHAKSLVTRGETVRSAMEYSEAFISEPPLGILAMNMLVFGTSVSTMYHIRRDDRFQDRILAAAMTIGFVVGKLAGLGTEAIILGILPWAILLALSLSAIGHRLVPMNTIPKIHESDLLD